MQAACAATMTALGCGAQRQSAATVNCHATCSTYIKLSRAITRFGCLCSAFPAVCILPATFKQQQHPAPLPRAFPVPPQQLCCRYVARQCPASYCACSCSPTSIHGAACCLLSAACRALLPSTPSSAPPCAGHCVFSAIIAAKEHAASVRKSRLRCFRRLPCCLPAAAALTRTSRRSILDSQPQLPRAIAGRSCFAVRLCHVRRKACVAAPSMMYPAQQRVAHCVDDCLRMNTP